MKRNEKEARRLTDIKEKVEPVIENIRPMRQAGGGDIGLVDVEDTGTVKVRLVGVYAGCAMPQQTLKLGVERLLMKEVTEVKVGEAV